MPLLCVLARPILQTILRGTLPDSLGGLRSLVRRFPRTPAGVAQLDRASVYETEGCRFESCHPRCESEGVGRGELGVNNHDICHVSPGR